MYDAIISDSSRQYGVPEAWIRAVIQTESSWQADAYRAEPKINDASYGLMQLLGRTARGLGFTGDAADLFRPEINIPLGTKLLGDLRARYGDDFRRIYSAYNSGKPDLWETSAEVARNVGRALTYLEGYIREEAGRLVASVGSASPDSLALMTLIGVVLMWGWAGKGKKKGK